MTRVLFLGFVLLATACGSKSFESLCANQVPTPACNTPCTTAPGSTDCPGGYHCSTQGKCDQFCTAGGGQCGDGYTCTSDGFCASSGSGGSGTPEPDANCPAVHATATKTTPSIQLLIDRSGSMLEDFSGTPKFQAVQDALLGKAAGPPGIVTKLQDQVYFGASMYPSNACPAILELGRAKSNEPAISTFLKAHPPSPAGSGDVRNTPTPPSIDAVVADFAANQVPPGSPPVIVLATDGLPNTCNDNNANTQSQSVTATKNAFAAGIKTYILSVGTIAGAATHLQEMANAGQGVKSGQPDATVFVGNNPDDLAAAFTQIIGGVLSCDLRLSGEIDPGDAPNGIVTINTTTTLTFGTDWTLDADHITLHILGNACTMLKALTNPVVDAEFPCGTVIL